jgi:hypothetical protein
MYFQTKNTLKSNCYRNTKQTLRSVVVASSSEYFLKICFNVLISKIKKKLFDIFLSKKQF